MQPVIQVQGVNKASRVRLVSQGSQGVEGPMGPQGQQDNPDRWGRLDPQARRGTQARRAQTAKLEIQGTREHQVTLGRRDPGASKASRGQVDPTVSQGPLAQWGRRAQPAIRDLLVTMVPPEHRDKAAFKVSRALKAIRGLPEVQGPLELLGRLGLMGPLVHRDRMGPLDSRELPGQSALQDQRAKQGTQGTRDQEE